MPPCTADTVVIAAQRGFCKLSLISLQEQYVLLVPKPSLQLTKVTILLMADGRWWQLLIPPYNYSGNIYHPGMVAHTRNPSTQESKAHQTTKRTQGMCQPPSLNKRRLALRRSNLSSLHEVPALPSFFLFCQDAKRWGFPELYIPAVWIWLLPCFSGMLRRTLLLWGRLFNYLFVLQSRVPLPSSECLGIHPAAQTGLEFRDLRDSAFWVQQSKAHPNMPGWRGTVDLSSRE